MNRITLQSAAFSGLPQPFLEAMRRLFDILDEEGKGLVSLSDISERWNPQEKNNDQLPKNVIENLRKVVNADGMLSFERFCAGLKIAILRHEAMKNKIVSTSSPSGDVDKDRFLQSTVVVREAVDNPTFGSGSFSPISRTSSMPNLVPGHSNQLHLFSSPIDGHGDRLMVIGPSPVPSEPVPVAHQLSSPPPKPPRDPFRLLAWKDELVIRRTGKYTEPQGRRHTLHGGLDFRMVKRLGELEDERSQLLEGLRVTSQCQEWFSRRLSNVEDRLRHGHQQQYSHKFDSEAFQARMSNEREAIRDLNNRFKCLLRGHSQSSTEEQQMSRDPDSNLILERQICRLKEQNKMLTEEVGRKSVLITNLEQEKSVLIRQLFQASGMARSSRSNKPSAAAPIPPKLADDNSFV